MRTATCLALLGLSALAALGDPDANRTKPDRVVYTPSQSPNRKLMDPAKTGDSYNDHFQVIYDAGRRQYYAFWTQGSWEGAGDHHICFAKSADGKVWPKPVVLAGSLCRARKSFGASWQQPILTKSGRLYCFWNQEFCLGKGGGAALAGFYSDDGGDTWSEPMFVPTDDPSHGRGCLQYRTYWINWQRPLRLLGDGRYGVSSSVDGTARFWQFENIDDDPEIPKVRIWQMPWQDALKVARLAEKDVFHPDDGRDAMEEGCAVRLPDGRLFMLMRTSTGHPAWSVSSDDGRTWADPKFLRDADGRAYLQPRSPCPIYDYDGDGAASGVYFALVHDAFDFAKTATAYQNRGQVFIIWGEFDPGAEQPIVFRKKRLLNSRDYGNAYYTSYTVAGGERILWYPDCKYFLLGKIIRRD